MDTTAHVLMTNYNAVSVIKFRKMEKKLTKLFSCLYGSFLYGTNLPESDRDEKVIVLPSLEDLLLGKSPTNKVTKSEGIDREEIPIQVFARDFLEGQTYALELAFAVKYGEAQQAVYDDRFHFFCAELREKFLTGTMHSMVRYAVNQANLYSSKGERLNCAREFKALLNRYIDDYVLTSWNEHLESDLYYLEKRYPQHFKVTTYDQNGKGKMEFCVKLLERVIPFTSSSGQALSTVQGIIDKYGKRAEAATGDNVDWKALSHALRIICEGIELLENRNLRYPYREIDCRLYRSIRQGIEDFGYVQSLIESNMVLLQKMESESDLPKLTPELRKEMKI